jgi:hypothetical protein
VIFLPRTEFKGYLAQSLKEKKRNTKNAKHSPSLFFLRAMLSAHFSLPRTELKGEKEKYKKCEIFSFSLFSPGDAFCSCSANAHISVSLAQSLKRKREIQKMRNILLLPACR